MAAATAASGRLADCRPARQIARARRESGSGASPSSATGTGSEVGRRYTDRVLLHRNLFEEDVLATAWLELKLPIEEDLRARLAATVGTEPGYLLTPRSARQRSPRRGCR